MNQVLPPAPSCLMFRSGHAGRPGSFMPTHRISYVILPRLAKGFRRGKVAGSRGASGAMIMKICGSRCWADDNKRRQATWPLTRSSMRRRRRGGRRRGRGLRGRRTSGGGSRQRKSYIPTRRTYNTTSPPRAKGFRRAKVAESRDASGAMTTKISGSRC